MADEKKLEEDNDDDGGTWTEIEVPEQLDDKAEEVFSEDTVVIQEQEET